MQLLLTLILVAAAIALLSIGWLLTGKTRIRRGSCGLDPNKLRNKDCGSKDFHCGLCSGKKKDTDDTDKHK